MAHWVPDGYWYLDGVTVDAGVCEAASLLGPHAAADPSEPYTLVRERRRQHAIRRFMGA